MTQKATAQLLRIATSTLSDMLHRSITRIREGHRIRGLKTIGIDEISYCKGHKYATLVYDLDRACVVWVGQGKGRETIDVFFNSSTLKRSVYFSTAAAADILRAVSRQAVSLSAWIMVYRLYGHCGWGFRR